MNASVRDSGGRSAALAQMLAGAAIIGTNGLMVRLAHTAPTVSAFWRMTLAALFLGLLVQFRHGWKPLPRVVLMWTLLPAAAFALDLWMWHRSILIVGPGLSTLLANAQVFFMAMAGVLLFGERLTGRFYIGLVCAFFGLWLLLGGDWATLPPRYHAGVWLGLATGVAYAAYNVGLKKAQAHAGETQERAPIEQILCLAAAGSATLLGLAALAEGDRFAIPDLHTGVLLLILALLGHCLAWVLISRAMQRLSAGMVGLLLLFQPIVAYLIDVVFLDRVTSGRQWLGLAVTLAGIFVAGLKPARVRSARESDQ